MDTPRHPGAVRRRLLPRVPADTPAGDRPRPDGRGRLLRHPGRRVGLVHLGTGGRTVRPRLARSRSSTAPTSAASRSSSARRPTPYRRGWPGATRRSPARPATGQADAVGRPAGGRLHPPGVPVPRRAGHPHRSSPATPTTPRSSGSRSTTSPACCCSTTTASSSASSTSCATRTATVETLNEAWGLVYWSHRLSTWADLWTPDGNCQPQYDLAWRAFQAKLTTEFIAWQAEHRPRVRPATTSSSPPASPTSGRRSTTPSSPGRSTSPPATRTTPCRTRSPCPSTRSPSAGLDDVGGMGLFHSRRPDVLLPAGAVPGHRDQRRRHRRIVRRTARPTTASGGRPPGRSSPAAPR